MSHYTRRQFIQTGAAAISSIALGEAAFAENKKRSATDWVTLGQSGVKVTRLGLGSGSNGGRVQREMGQEAFTKMIRHAYDRGVRFFDTADNYGGMHEMLAKALEGIDRDTYTIQTKMKWGGDPDPMVEIDRFRKELNTDYFDSFLLHCATESNWTETLKRQMDILRDAKDKQLIRSHGASVHGMLPLRDMTTSQWMDVSLLRVNHNGTKMDNLENNWNEPGPVDECVANIRKIHESGSGVIGMKIIGNGDFTDPEVRDKSFKYVMNLDCVDAIIIGTKSEAEVDEAIERMNKHLNA